MNCPVCFFRDKTQKELKQKSFGIPRFEDKLINYKNEFLHGINSLLSQKDCTCYTTYNHSHMILWTDTFIQHLKSNISEIGLVFDALSSFYSDFIGINQKIALDNFWHYLDENGLVNGTEHPIFCSKLLFRGRKKGPFDERDKESYFHIPFTMRHLIGNQRFSIDGQPLLYLGSSIPTIEKELNVSVDDMAVAAFLPKYTYYSHKKIYNLKNYFNEVIENSLPAIFGAGSMIDFNDTSIVPNQLTVMDLLKKSILMQLCTFPVEIRGSFISEYVLPQMLTTALMDNDYAGVTFPSTKDFSNITDNHRFSSHHINFGIFVEYDKTNDFDEKLLESFTIYTLNGTESFDYNVESVLSEIESIIDAAIAAKVATPDLVFPATMSKIHFEYLQKAYLSDLQYFDTKSGKLELELYMKMIHQFQSSVSGITPA